MTCDQNKRNERVEFEKMYEEMEDNGQKMISGNAQRGGIEYANKSIVRSRR